MKRKLKYVDLNDLQMRALESLKDKGHIEYHNGWQFVPEPSKSNLLHHILEA